MGLVLKEKISLDTPRGVSEVQLLFGDITQLPEEEKVDIVCVSAFPGDYNPLPGTLIGALWQRLNLSVNDLAKDKEWDLRDRFNCWLSKRLPVHLPYKRLVCFERMNRFEPLPDQISGLFRAMFALVADKEATVITPLLATGDQGHSVSVVLEATVTAACHWIKVGLPLKCLKIVIFTTNPHAVSHANAEQLQRFTQLKATWAEKNEKEDKEIQSRKQFDVCLSYANEDMDVVMEICSDLQKLHSGIVIHKEQLTYNHEEVWQDAIFNIMIHSRKIIAVMTPHYVDKAECLEQYNLALCCNQLTHTEVLAPFYMQTVDSFPSYMTLIQYTECRVRREGEKAEEKILTACCMLVKEIHKDMMPPPSSETSESEVDGDVTSVTAASNSSETSTVYDVFISYAHKSPEAATKMFENLQDIDPNLKVFLDRSELRTGNSWQETLYAALDKAKVVVTFISQKYIESTVCQEEYNIALARYLSMDGIYFLPLLTDDDLKEVPLMYSGAPLVDVSGLSLEEEHFMLAQAVAAWLDTLKTDSPVVNRFCHVVPEPTQISPITAKKRRQDFDKRFKLNQATKCIELRCPSKEDGSAESSITPTPKTVVISTAQDCFQYAAVLSHLLREQNKENITCEFLLSPGIQGSKLQLLDSADMVVMMVSDVYLASVVHQHEMHIALCRQRKSKERRVVYLMEANHTKPKPVYAHLLHHSLNLGDDVWFNIAKTNGMDRVIMMVEMQGDEPYRVNCGRAEYEALYTAALDISDHLFIQDNQGGSGMLTNIINLVDLLETEQKSVQVSECLAPLSSLREKNYHSLNPTGTKEPSKSPTGSNTPASAGSKHSKGSAKSLPAQTKSVNVDTEESGSPQSDKPSGAGQGLPRRTSERVRQLREIHTSRSCHIL